MTHNTKNNKSKPFPGNFNAAMSVRRKIAAFRPQISRRMMVISTLPCDRQSLPHHKSSDAVRKRLLMPHEVQSGWHPQAFGLGVSENRPGGPPLQRKGYIRGVVYVDFLIPTIDIDLHDIPIRWHGGAETNREASIWMN
ncbi:MAG: hypothetical protein PHR28_01215 [candidate division Zixibacteria bacterium]|nr:hypothetical protein [candidate division Zixibacteria bacterium]